MSLLSSQSIQKEFIKLRWMEPYATAGVNRTHFKTIPRGVYNGFVVKPVIGTRQIVVAHDDPQGWDNAVSGYNGGGFDTASGWSVAIHSSIQGYNTAVVIQASPGRNFTFDLDAYGGQSVFAVIDVQYQLMVETAAQVKIVQAADLDADPTMIVLARIDVPAFTTLLPGNIVLDDPAYPRVKPYADQYKPGFMSRKQALDLEALQAVSGSPALMYEVDITTNGPQAIDLPEGYFYVVGADDLWVHKNGVLKTAGALRDYVEIDRGDGRGEQIMYVGLDLRSGDRVKFRIQKYAAHLTSTLTVLDENVVIDQNVIRMRFTGTGVQVIPDGPRQVRVAVGGGGGGGAAAVKTKLNSTVSTIAPFTAVRLLQTDNSIVPFDTAVSGACFYGVTLQTINTMAFGDVQVAGICPGAAAGVSGGGNITDRIFIAHGGGGILTTTPPDPLFGQVIEVGFLDGPDSVSGATAADLVFDRRRLS